jgi:oxygen-dependent protoporphyrinogen oxidase
MKHIGVIGAGIAGLTAAHYLKRSGHHVTVFEASDRVGGRMTTDLVDGCVFDRGFQFFTSTYSTLLALIDEVGLTSELREVTPWNAILRSQRLRNVSIDHPWSILTSGCLTPLELLRSLAGLVRIRKATRGLPLEDYAAWTSLDDEESVRFVCQHLGDAFLDYMLEPYFRGCFYQSAGDISKAMAFMLLGLTFDKVKVLSLRPGVGALVDRLASNLEVRLRYPILRVSATTTNGDGRDGILLHSPLGDVSVDSVIIATTASVAKSIYPDATAVESELLRTQYSSTIAMLVIAQPHWRLPASLKNVYAILMPAEDNSGLSAIGMMNQKQQDGGAGERLYITPSIEAMSRLSSLGDGEIVNEILFEVDRYLPGISTSVQRASVVRWDEAVPKSPVGRTRALRRYREALAPSARVILAGDYMGFPHGDSAAYTGKWAAEFLTQSTSGSPAPRTRAAVADRLEK